MNCRSKGPFLGEMPLNCNRPTEREFQGERLYFSHWLRSTRPSGRSDTSRLRVDPQFARAILLSTSMATKRQPFQRLWSSTVKHRARDFEWRGLTPTNWAGTAGGSVRRLLFAAILLMHGAPSMASTDAVILNANRYDVLGGRYSIFAKFQANLQRVLDECGKPTPPVVPPGEQPNGRIGRETRQGISRSLGCESLRQVPENSPARDGVLTEAVWRAVMGGAPLPTVKDRADALVLSFEGTDFGDAPEWNLCQDNRPWVPRESNRWAPDFACYNESDPCSFLTWGPRGATAGSGRELQFILWMVWKEIPALIDKVFGPEAGSLPRFFRLQGGDRKGCYTETPVKRFLCAIWMDPARSGLWEKALVELGQEPLVRRAYARLYALWEFDGDKLRTFFQLWHKLGLAPNEVDYAFFLDRITHLGGPREDSGGTAIEALKACMRADHRAIRANGAARRCLARLQPHEMQPQYRLARDVAYYLDAYPEGALSHKEIRTWANYVPLSAAYTFGLSEDRPAYIEDPASLTSLGPDLPLADSSDLAPLDLKNCPSTVLSPSPRKPSH